jgi:hypothetical protein
MKKLLLLFSLIMLVGCEKTEPIIESLDTPLHVTIENNVISFDTVSGNDVTYNLFIEDVTETSVIYKEFTDIKETQYSLPQLEINKLYEVRVQAKNKDGISDKSDAYTINTFIKLDTLYASYNTNESIPVTILGIDVSDFYYITYGTINSTKLNKDTFSYEQNVLSLAYSNLNTESTLTFYVFTEAGYHPVEIDKTSTPSPSIHSPNVAVFTAEDMYFQFDLAGGEFVEISGSDIGVDDFTLIHNTLIINKDFLSSLFTSNIDRTNIILSYQLKTNDETIIGYLFIQKN